MADARLSISETRQNTVPAAATGLPISRSQLEHLIEDAIAILDALDPDPDLEENGDLEPSIGCYQGVVDVEWDTSDDEPSLGSPEGALDMSWGDGGCSDLEQDARIPAKLRPHHAGGGVPYRGIRRWHEEQAATALDDRLGEIVRRKKHRARNDRVSA